ncbi:MAG TPA: tagaturonate epimerase family protein [Pirellulaceae bacterium]|nr:tagaturonate epimerase family protein [Pirellulaceae bacterium]
MTEIQAPQPLGLQPSFGFGDRLGLATPGHLDALRSYGGEILPIFAQQSIREMSRTGRKPSDVMQDATRALAAASYTGIWSADADHLKTPEDVNATAGAGFVFFTIDPSDYVDPQADDYPIDVLGKKFLDIRDDVNWADDYIGRTVSLSTGDKIEFDLTTVRRAAVKYGRAIAHAVKMGAHCDRVMGKRDGKYEIELSVDETPQPTTPAEHYIIAEQCLRANVRLVSLAPRYVGDFEKGIDFKGDIAAFEQSLKTHAAIAKQLGPYKLSLHSGSDKLSIYEIFARVTAGQFHVKTAGTSYLEALRVAARHERKLFRRVIDFSRERFERDRATYHISARLENVPSPAAISDDAKLEQLYLDLDDGRQILHVTFGSVLSDTGLGPAVRDVLAAHPETHRDVLARHFGNHLKALCRGLK